MKLLTILNDVLKKRSTRSWLSPDGNFFDAVDDKHQIISHETAALDILKSVGKISHEQKILHDTPSNILFKRGWQRIAMGSQGQYLPQIIHTNNPYKRPNNKQLSALIDLAIDKDIEKIAYDDGTSRGYVKNIIWDKHNIL